MFEENKTANNAAESTFEADSNTNDEKTQENLLVENDYLDCSTQGRIATLKKNLQAVYQKMEKFNEEVKFNIEKLKNQSSFDRDSVFADEILQAAAFAKIFDVNAFLDFKSDIQRQIIEKKIEKFVQEWQSAVKEKIGEIEERRRNLATQRIGIESKINSLKLFAADDVLNKLNPISGYSVSERGVEKIVGERLVEVCAEPIAIKGVLQNYEDDTIKLILSHMRQGKWKDIPAQPAEVISSRRDLVKLSAYGFPIADHNSLLAVEYLYKFKSAHLDKLPFAYTVPNCGWRKMFGQEFFIDPRRNCEILDDDGNTKKIIVDENNILVKSLKSVGTLAEWKKAYEIAKKSVIARITVAASVAPPLLELVGERNFVLYIHGKTKGGKTLSQSLGASAVGNEDLIITFDGTNNGLLAMAAETTDYPLFIDEKQASDKPLKEQFQRFIYSVGNGKGRSRANKDGSFKGIRKWKNITICNGETPLLDDNATGGSYTRLLQIHAPKTILSAGDCKTIRDIIKENYGVAFTIFLEEVLKYGKENLNKLFQDHCEAFQSWFTDTLSEYSRYLAVLTLADYFLNVALGENALKASADAIKTAKAFAAYFPTIEEVADAPREKDFVTDFIAQNQRCFVGATPLEIEQLPSIYGKFENNFIYVSVPVLKTACKNAGFDSQKVVADLVEDGFFVPDDKIPKGRKKPYPYVQKKIGTKMNCYRIPKEKISDD